MKHTHKETGHSILEIAIGVAIATTIIGFTGSHMLTTADKLTERATEIQHTQQHNIEELMLND